MKNIENAVENLVVALVNTDEYQRYLKAKSKISQGEFEKIDSYKYLRTSLMENHSAEVEERAKELYKNLMVNPDTRDYIICEKRILNMVTGVYDEIGKGLSIIETAD